MVGTARQDRMMFHPTHYQLKNARGNMSLESRFAPSTPDVPGSVSAQEAAADSHCDEKPRISAVRHHSKQQQISAAW